MHLTGKIFAFLTLCLAGAAVFFTAKTLDRQNEWSQRVEAARAGFQDSTAKLPDVRKQATKLKSDLELERLQWGNHWNDVAVQMQDPNRGLISIGIGRNDNLVRETENGDDFPLLYAFQSTAEGTRSFVGEFRVVDADINRAALQLTRTPRTGETANWNFSQPWRFRNSIPSAMRQSESELMLKMTIMEQKIKDRTQSLTIQQGAVAAAQQALDNRMKELQGNPDAPEGAGDEYTLGLVETLKAAEKKRNAALAEVQNLRVELNQLHQTFQQLLSDNMAIENDIRSRDKTASKE